MHQTLMFLFKNQELTFSDNSASVCRREHTAVSAISNHEVLLPLAFKAMRYLPMEASLNFLPTIVQSGAPHQHDLIVVRSIRIINFAAAYTAHTQYCLAAVSFQLFALPIHFYIVMSMTT